MSFAGATGEQLRPDELRPRLGPDDPGEQPDMVEAFQRIGLAIMRDQELTRGEALVLLGLLADVFEAAGVIP